MNSCSPLAGIQGEAELSFVPIRPGTYELYAKGLKEKGTSVTINVK